MPGASVLLPIPSFLCPVLVCSEQVDARFRGWGSLGPNGDGVVDQCSMLRQAGDGCWSATTGEQTLNSELVLVLVCMTANCLPCALSCLITARWTRRSAPGCVLVQMISATTGYQCAARCGGS